MSNTQLLLSIVALQQGLLGLMWGGASFMGLSRLPVLHWAASALAMAASVALMALDVQASPWLGLCLAHILLVASTVALRRGLQCFGDTAPSDREHAAQLLIVSLLLVLLAARGDAQAWLVAVASWGAAWSLVRAAVETPARLRFEFGPTGAVILATPVALLGAAFAARALLAPWLAEDVSGELSTSGGLGTAWGVFLLAATWVLNLTLAAAVVLRVMRRLRHLSEHDPLTGALNRRGFEQLLTRECERLRRYQQPFAVLAVDLDHFKSVNDRFGHAVGDDVLVAVTQTLACGVREVDRIARMGGEEFCVLLPCADEAGARATAQRLLQLVQRASYGPAGKNVSITVSIGLAVAGDAAETPADLLRRLDRALLAAQAEGHNRVQMAEPPLLSRRLATI